jgi:hypothetical protein
MNYHNGALRLSGWITFLWHAYEASVAVFTGRMEYPLARLGNPDYTPTFAAEPAKFIFFLGLLAALAALGAFLIVKAGRPAAAERGGR